MKTFKTIFAAVLFLSVSSFAVAQDNLQATASASAEIIVEVNVSKVQDIDFGPLTLNSTANLNVVSGENENLTSSAQAGKFSVIATQYASIGISWTTGNLVHANGTELAYTPQVAHTTDAEATNGDAFTQGNFTAAAADYFLVGGTLVVPTGSPAGTYSGSFTLTAEIN